MQTTIASESVTRRTGNTRWFFLLAMACFIWAGQGTAVKFLNRQLGPIAITFLPFYVTTALMVPLLLRERRRNPEAVRPGWGAWWKFVVAGVGGQVVAQLGMTWGISKSLASNAAVFNLLIPVITAVLASFMLRERITVLRIAALFIGLTGVMLMSVDDLQRSSFAQMRYLEGNLLILGGCLGSSFYNVYCKGLLRRFQELELLIFSYITASVASLPLLVWAEPFHWETLAALDWRSWLAFSFLALFMYGASMLLFFKALRHLDVTVSSASLYLVPVFGVAMAAVFLGERLRVATIGGAFVVLAATVLIMRYDRSV